MSGQSVKTSNGHNSATRHPTDCVFGSRLGSFSKDRLALFNLTAQCSRVSELHEGLLLREALALDRLHVRFNMYLVLLWMLVNEAYRAVSHVAAGACWTMTSLVAKRRQRCWHGASDWPLSADNAAPLPRSRESEWVCVTCSDLWRVTTDHVLVEVLVRIQMNRTTSEHSSFIHHLYYHLPSETASWQVSNIIHLRLYLYLAACVGLFPDLIGL